MAIINKEWIEELKPLLSTPKKIVLSIHFNPDGDSLGASLALRGYLLQRGHAVTVIAPNAVPGVYLWMPGAAEIIDFEMQNKVGKEKIAEAEVIFALDYNELARTGAMQEALGQAKAQFIMIDHHPDPEPFTKFLFSDCSVSSASELTYRFIQSMNGVSTLDRDLATCIFTGIMTDTGMFSHNSNNPDTFRIVAELLDAGIDKDQIKSNVFDNNSTDKLRLMGFSLSEKLTVLRDYKVGYIALGMDDLKRFNFRKGDNDGLVNYPLSIRGVRFSVLFVEQENLVKISMRSKGDFDVNQLMRDHFQGGGHKNAAGGRSYVSLDETVKKFESILPLYKDLL